MLLTFILNHPYILAVPAGVLLVLLLRFFLSRRKQEKRLDEMAQLKRRDEALTESLRNPLAEKQRTPEGPMEIAWDENAIRGKGKGQTVPMVELTELATYSRRRYVYRLHEPVRIGSGKTNQLEVLLEGVEKEHCELFLRGQKVCLRSIGNSRTTLKRGKTTALVSNTGVYLRNGDHIQIGETEIQFRQFKG